ncbi:hypothetical protein T484DRAFT_1749075 [Baffinella frigidus]|nr:hypothetical protein T484DRAFT_1749075 [Cryptophyta sp. CCMP2293]
MTSAKIAAHDEPHTSLHTLLKAVEVAHEIEARQGTSNADRLVAHDHVLVQCRHEPHTRLRILPLKAVEVEEAAPSRRGTRHGAVYSHRLVAQDHVLVQCRREQRGFPGILHMHRIFEMLEAAGEPRNFDESAPVFPPSTPAMPCQGFPLTARA